MFRRLLDHPRITVELGSEYSDAMASTRFDRVIFTGPIDEFFDYSHGPLPYRSLRFERRSEARHAGLPVGTVNYPNEFEFTRISDQRHLSGELDAAPLLITEYLANTFQASTSPIIQYRPRRPAPCWHAIRLTQLNWMARSFLPAVSATTPITTWIRRVHARSHYLRSVLSRLLRVLPMLSRYLPERQFVRTANTLRRSVRLPFVTG